MENKSFTDLEAWKKGRQLVNLVYALSKTFPKEESFGLISQIRRCVVSIPANIAEGMGRNTSKDTIQFLYIARGSLYELETLLILANDQKYIDDISEVIDLLTETRKILNGLINYYSNKK
jgi:four helix bundle protein